MLSKASIAEIFSNQNLIDPFSPFKSIGEVSEELKIPQHVIRFWETKFHQLKPNKRRGGHRYYRPEDVAMLGTIKVLLYEKGFTIKGAQKYMRELQRNQQKQQFDLFVDGSKPGAKQELTQKQKEKINEIYKELEELNGMLHKYLN